MKFELRFQCPVCKESGEPDEQWHYIAPDGFNYWCCSGVCFDIARDHPEKLPRYELEVLKNEIQLDSSGGFPDE